MQLAHTSAVQLGRVLQIADPLRNSGICPLRLPSCYVLRFVIPTVHIFAGTALTFGVCCSASTGCGSAQCHAVAYGGDAMLFFTCTHTGTAPALGGVCCSARARCSSAQCCAVPAGGACNIATGCGVEPRAGGGFKEFCQLCICILCGLHMLGKKIHDAQ